MTLLILDLEATCWSEETQPELRAQQRTLSEVIEVGIARIDPATYAVQSTFQAFVRPQRHPELTPFCIQLTGIQQADVDAADSLPEVWARLVAWAGGDLGHVTMGSWGLFDHIQLTRECAERGLPAPWAHRDIKAEMTAKARAERHPQPRMGLRTALAHYGLAFEGNAHRALDDALNVVRVMQAAKL